MDHLNGFYTDFNGHQNGFQSSPQDSHQTKLESFRKTDAERDAFFQVRSQNLRSSLKRQVFARSNTTSKSCVATKTYEKSIKRNAMTLRTKKFPDVCGKKGQIMPSALLRVYNATQ